MFTVPVTVPPLVESLLARSVVKFATLLCAMAASATRVGIPADPVGPINPQFIFIMGGKLV